jgi:Leu/Phe-tRNA-protein transferase
MSLKKDEDYIPPHLKGYIFHSQEDFYVSRYFDPLLLAHLMYEGFLPIASEYRNQCILLPKLHLKRCLLLLNESQHIPKTVKKRGRKYKLILNRSLEEVVKGCHKQHGIPWLYPPIVESFKVLFQRGEQGMELYPNQKVRFWTIELLDIASDKLCAGELGYTVGKVYTSLTGFSNVSGAGTVQLYALGRLLRKQRFEMWDLGMSMQYKLDMGAEDHDRDDFLEFLHKYRKDDIRLSERVPTDIGIQVQELFEETKVPKGEEEDKADQVQQTSKKKEKKKEKQQQQKRKRIESE